MPVLVFVPYTESPDSPDSRRGSRSGLSACLRAHTYATTMQSRPLKPTHNPETCCCAPTRAAHEAWVDLTFTQLHSALTYTNEWPTPWTGQLGRPPGRFRACLPVCLPGCEISFRIDGIPPSSSPSGEYLHRHLRYLSSPTSFSLLGCFHWGIPGRTVFFNHRHVYFEETAYRMIDHPETDRSSQASGPVVRILL